MSNARAKDLAGMAAPEILEMEVGEAEILVPEWQQYLVQWKGYTPKASEWKRPERPARILCPGFGLASTGIARKIRSAARCYSGRI
jgi:hypothetical protein